MTPVAAWASIVEDPQKRAAYIEQARPRRLRPRRPGTRSHEIIAAANAYTAKTYGPDRVFGFSPIPAMSMVSLRRRRALSVAARRRLPVVLRLVLRPAAGLARRPGASRPTCPNRPTGTIPASSSCGARTCRRRARPMLTSTPRPATAAPRAS